MTRALGVIAALAVVAFAVGACGSDGASAAASTGAEPGAIGDACAATSSCAVGLKCETEDPGGQCVKDCAGDADCGEGNLCDDEHLCYRACATAADCTREGYACVGSPPRTICDVADEGSGGGGG